MHRVVGAQAVEGMHQVLAHLHGVGIELLGPVKRDDGDPVAVFDVI